METKQVILSREGVWSADDLHGSFELAASGVSFKLCKQPQLPQIILRSIYDGIAIKIIQHIFKKN